MAVGKGSASDLWLHNARIVRGQEVWRSARGSGLHLGKKGHHVRLKDRELSHFYETS